MLRRRLLNTLIAGGVTVAGGAASLIGAPGAPIATSAPAAQSLATVNRQIQLLRSETQALQATAAADRRRLVAATAKPAVAPAVHAVTGASGSHHDDDGGDRSGHGDN